MEDPNTVGDTRWDDGGGGGCDDIFQYILSTNIITIDTYRYSKGWYGIDLLWFAVICIRVETIQRLLLRRNCTGRSLFERTSYATK